MTTRREGGTTLIIFLRQTGGEADKTGGKRSQERACFIRAEEGGLWEPAKRSGPISRSKEEGVRGEKKFQRCSQP